MMQTADPTALVPISDQVPFIPSWLKLELRDCQRAAAGRSLLKFGNGELYLLELDATLRTVDIYRLVADSPSLEKLATVPCPVGTWKGATATIAGTSLLFTGGENPSPDGSQICALDLQTFEWREAKTLTHLPPRCRHSATLVGSKTYIFGGLAVSLDASSSLELGPHLGDLWALSLPGPDLMEVVPCQVQPPARCDHAAAGLGSNLVVIGGMGGAGALHDVWCFDTLLSQWQELPVVGALAPTNLVACSAAAVGPLTLVVFGLGDNHDSQEVWLLHLSALPGSHVAPNAYWEPLQAAGLQPPAGVTGSIVDCGEGCIFMLSPRHSTPEDHGCDLHVLALTEQAAARTGLQLVGGLDTGLPFMPVPGSIALLDKKRKLPSDTAPKKVTSYNIFCAEMREMVRTEHSMLNAREVEKMMGQRWAEMDQERKKAYEEQARRQNAANAAAFAAQRSSMGAAGGIPNKLTASPSMGGPKKKSKGLKVEPLPRASGPQPTTFQLFTPNPSLIGSSVEGQIDAVFNAGYLATVNVNGFTYRALLFSPYLALSVPMALQPTSGP